MSTKSRLKEEQRDFVDTLLEQPGREDPSANKINESGGIGIMLSFRVVSLFQITTQAAAGLFHRLFFGVDSFYLIEILLASSNGLVRH